MSAPGDLHFVANLPFSFFQSVTAKGGSLVASWDGMTNAWLSIRELDQSGNFSQAINCFPATITILPAQTSHRTSLRDLFVHQNSTELLELRFGNRRVHPSEIFVVGMRDNQWRQSTLLGAAAAAGVPRSFIPELLREIGLPGYENRSPVTLHLRELRRFAIVCSFFSKAQFLLLDQPFTGEDIAMGEKLAALIAEAALVTKKVMLVSRLQICPRAWKENSCVITYDESLGAGVLNANSLHNIKGLRGVIQVDSEADFIVTRPCAVPRPPARSAVQEAISYETISNPHFGSDAVDVGVSPARPSGFPLPAVTPSKILTTVSLRDRLHSRFQIAPLLETAKQIIRERKQLLTATVQLPGSQKIIATARLTPGYLLAAFIGSAALVLVVGFAFL